jgi:hypothetical protein
MKIHEYNEMMAYMLRPRQKFAIGGGVVEGKDLGSREGFADPNIEFPFLGSTGQTDYRIGRFKDTGKFFRRVGKKKQTTIIQEEGESLEDFRKREGPRTDLAFDKTVTTRKYIDNWTKNWLDNNLQKYGVKDFDVMLNDLSSAWQNEIEIGNVPEPKKNFNLTTPNLNLPNITSAQDVRIKQKSAKTDLTAFTYDDVRFYNNQEGTKALQNKVLAQYRKIFYKNKIQTNPALRQGLKKFYDFMAMDKAGLPQGGGLTIRDFLKTEVTDDVKFLIDREASGLDKGAKKEVFHSFPDLKNNYDVFTASKAKLKAIERETEGRIKAGPKTSAQSDELINQIKNQNKIVADMKPEELVKDKKLIQSLRLVINAQTGQASFIGYTENDPRVIKKGVKTDLELAEHAIERAKKGSLFSYDHISKRSFGKMNTQYPNNIQGANYITNTHLDNARRFLEVPENRNTPAAQNLDKVLNDLGLTIRGKEYDRIYGNKENIIFNSNTNRSNIVDQQLIKKDVIPGRLGKVAGALGILVGTTAFGKEKSTLPQGSPAQINLQDQGFTDTEKLLAGTTAAGAAYAAKKPILKTLGKIARPIGRVLGAPSVAGGFGLSQFVDINPFRFATEEEREAGKSFITRDEKFGSLKEDPSFALAGADLLLPELTKQVGIRSLLANPFGRLARGFTPLGIGLQGIELINQARKEQRRIDAMSPEEREDFIAEQESLLDFSA